MIRRTAHGRARILSLPGRAQAPTGTVFVFSFVTAPGSTPGGGTPREPLPAHHGNQNGVAGRIQ